MMPLTDSAPGIERSSTLSGYKEQRFPSHWTSCQHQPGLNFKLISGVHVLPRGVCLEKFPLEMHQDRAWLYTRSAEGGSTMYILVYI